MSPSRGRNPQEASPCGIPERAAERPSCLAHRFGTFRQRRFDCERVSICMEKAREAAESETERRDSVTRRRKRGGLHLHVLSSTSCSSTPRPPSPAGPVKCGRIRGVLHHELLRSCHRASTTLLHRSRPLGSGATCETSHLSELYINRRPCTELPLSLRDCHANPESLQPLS